MIQGPRKLVNKAVFISQLLKIEKEYHLEIKRKHMDVAGQCEQIDDNEFVIYIDKAQDKSEIIRTLAHEMTHLRQYVNGDLDNIGPVVVNDVNCYVSTWKGETHINSNSMDEYFLSPWEMEARAYEGYVEWKWRNK